MAYPSGGVTTFTTKTDLVDTVYAENVNTLQTDVHNIEASLGAGILTPPASYSATFVTPGPGTPWADLTSRIINLEQGIGGDTHTQYAKIAGGSTITASGAAVKPLVLKGAASQSANLFEVQNSSGTVLFKVDQNGVSWQGTEKVASGATLNPLFLIGA